MEFCGVGARSGCKGPHCEIPNKGIVLKAELCPHPDDACDYGSLLAELDIEISEKSWQWPSDIFFGS